MDISCIPMKSGFVYLVAVIDWFTRRVLAWRVSISMEVDFYVEAVEKAMARHGKPQIFNTDQTSAASSRAQRSPDCWPPRAFGSAWTARASSATTSSSSGFGGRSSTRRSICEPMTASRRPMSRSAAIWRSTIASAHIRAGSRDAGTISFRPSSQAQTQALAD